MENVRNRRDIKLKKKWLGRFQVKNLLASPQFKSRTIFGENLVAIEMHKTKVELNKPIIIGMAVLEISKLCMYDYHYRYMKPKYGTNCKLLYTDTDSFIYEMLNIDDFYADMKEDIHRFDTSDYPSDNIHGIPLQNKKVPGLMKDENCGKCITEFVGLRAKMYSVRVGGIDAIKKAKGVKSYVVRKSITFDDYLKCMQDSCIMIRNQNSIRSKEHNVFSISCNKIALNPHDDKRYILEDSINTLPWGHHMIPNVD